MRPDIIFSFLLLAVLSSSCVDAEVKFGPLCCGNPNNQKRECDGKYGCGDYGASRGNRKHMGLDIVCDDGDTVIAPFDVTINGRAKPYGNGNDIDDGIKLSGGGLCFKLFYVKPDKLSGTLKKGEKIGSLLPMQNVYDGITSHVHVQMCDGSDPTNYINPGENPYMLSSLFVDAEVKFGPLCCGKPNNQERECDGHGCGKYGASRGNRKHMGLDIVCDDGDTVIAPFDVTINGRAKPYGNGNDIDDGIKLSGGGLCFKLFYVMPDKLSGTLKKGEKIGSLLPMQKVYPGITSHVHVQMCDKSDPTKYF